MSLSSVPCPCRRKQHRLFFFVALAGMALLLRPLPEVPDADDERRSLARQQHHSNQTGSLSNSTTPPVSIKSGLVARAAVDSHLYAPITLPNITRKVAFVHVGKAGGNTVRAAFPRLQCRKRMRPSNPGLAECYAKRTNTDSPFSQQCDLEVHMGGVKPQVELRGFTTFLYAIRNPITRAISSYSYLHHNNTKSPTAQSKHYLKEHFYKSCFPTLQHLLQTLHNTTTLPENAAGNSSYSINHGAISTSFLEYNSPEHPQYCSRMAIAVLKGEKPLVAQINIHLRDNYQFYHAKTYRAFPDKEVLVVRTENLWEDIKDLDLATGGTGQFKAAGKVANENVKTKESRSDPTPQQLRELCCILWEDIEVYQEILYLGSNLPYRSKLQSMQDVWSTCGIDSAERDQYTEVPQGESNPQALVFSWSRWQQDKCPSFYV